MHDIVVRRRKCGGSTLTQQLAKNFFLTPDKTISRKIAELMITYQLEARFTKRQIFEDYASRMNLVHRGSYEIDGVAQASQTLFGKDMRQLSLGPNGRNCCLVSEPELPKSIPHPERASSGATLCSTRWWRPGHYRR